MYMRVHELRSIVNYCGIDKERRIMVQIKYADGTKENCYVESFNQFSDCLVLNVSSDVKTNRKED